MGTYVGLKFEDGVATVTLTRAESANALSIDLLKELSATLTQIADDDSIDVVIFTGTGRFFSAGEDLNGLAPATVLTQVPLAMATIEQIRKLPQPTIAAVNGYAVTAGMGIALCCDLRIASENAVFGASFVRLGAAGAGVSQILPREIGLARTKEWLLTGAFVSAQEALQMGFVSRVVSGDRLLDEARDLARKIQANDRNAVRLIKKTVNEGCSLGLEAGMTLEASASYETLLKGHDDLSKLSKLVKERNKAAMGMKK